MSDKEREYVTLSVRHLKYRLSLIILNICPINGPVAVTDMPCLGVQGGVAEGNVPAVALGGSVCPGHRWDQNPSSASPLFPEISKQVAELYHK